MDSTPAPLEPRAFASSPLTPFIKCLSAFIWELDAAYATWLESAPYWTDDSLSRHEAAKLAMRKAQTHVQLLLRAGTASAIIPPVGQSRQQWIAELVGNVNEACRMFLFTHELRPGQEPKPHDKRYAFIEQYRDMYDRLPALRESIRRAEQHLTHVRWTTSVLVDKTPSGDGGIELQSEARETQKDNEPANTVWLTAAETARFIGVSDRTVRNWIRNHKIQFLNNEGTRYLFSVSELDAQRRAARPQKSE